MKTIVYDGTFEGWLSAVFDVYEYKFSSVNIIPKSLWQQDVFNEHHESEYRVEKAARVWKGLSAKISVNALNQLYRSFLSEEKGMENILLQYVRYAFEKKQTIESDYSHPAVLAVVQTAKKVYREKHRMEAFVRFQLTADGLYHAVCQPDFNVLPLIEKHFKNRYADQRWLIYDSRRKWGLYYDLQKVECITLNFNEEQSGDTTPILIDETETLYQQLWQQYFTSVNIQARKNMKLHIQHMPKRYWKFLPEKKPSAL